MNSMNIISKIRSFFAVIGILILAVTTSLITVYLYSIISPDNILSTNLTGILFIKSTIISFLGMLIGVLCYLFASRVRFSRIRIQWNIKQTLTDIAGYSGIVIGLFITFGIVISILQINTPSSSLTTRLSNDFNTVILFIPVIVLFNAPIEEFIFRGVIQERLNVAFSTPATILLTSAFFSSLHVANFTTISTNILPPLAIIFSLSIVLCYSYEKTSNLFVPVGIHIIYNLVQLSLLFPV